MNKKEIISVILIFSLALLLRLAYVVFLKQNYFFYDNPSSDVSYYQEWAREIARVNWIGTKTFWGLPLYPYFLAALWPLAGLCVDRIKGV